MMRLGCTGPCKSTVIVEIKDVAEESLFNRPQWEKGFPCPFPLCGGRLLKDTVAFRNSDRPPVHVSALEFYRRVCGQGEASFEVVTKILTTKRIVWVDGEAIGEPERSLIKSLTFEDGTKLHFGTSRHGACAYKLEEPVSADVETDLEGRDPDRAQAGRADQAGEDESGPGGSVSTHVGAVEPAGPESVPAMPAAGEVPPDYDRER